MKIGIFGGTFDPFTKAHAEIIKAAIDQKLVDEVLIVPTVVDYYRNHKTKWLSYEDRITVIKNVINHIKADYRYTERIYVDTTEIEFAENNAPYIVNKRRYIDTLNQLIYNETKYDDDTFPPIEFYTIIGSDSYKNFKTWADWEEILKLSKLIVVNGRDGEDVQLDIPKIDLRIDPEYSGISSTEIRKQYMLKSYEDYFADTFNNSVIESVRYRTPIFDLVKKTVPNLDFHPVGINSKDWVTMIVRYDDDFIMVKQLRYGLMKDQIEFPCGMIEDDEEPIDAGIRELKEETGIELLNKDQIQYLGRFAANPAFMNNYMHYFYVDLTTAQFVQLDPARDEHEKLSVEFINRQDVIANILDTENNENSVFMGIACYKYLAMNTKNMLKIRD